MGAHPYCYVAATGDHTRPETPELLADRVVHMSLLGALLTAVAARSRPTPPRPW